MASSRASFTLGLPAWLLFIAAATENREARIFLKPRVYIRKLALQERRAAVGLNDPCMDAIAAQEGWDDPSMDIYNDLVPREKP